MKLSLNLQNDTHFHACIFSKLNAHPFIANGTNRRHPAFAVSTSWVFLPIIYLHFIVHQKLASFNSDKLALAILFIPIKERKEKKKN